MNRIIISKSLVYSIILWSSIVTVSGQVSQKIGGNPGTIDPKAVLELESTTKGFLLPRMTAVQVAAITSPTSGMIVFCTDCGVGSDGELRISYNGVWQTYKGNVTGNITGNAATVTTNANLSGPITSSGNTTSVASQTGTGSTFVMNTSPTLVTPVLGAATGTSLSVTGQLTSTVATGTAPLVVTSTTPVANLNIGGNAATVTTNANLSGAVTSSGNTTSLGSFTSANLATALTDETGTGVAVLATSPTLVTPVLGAATGTSLSVTGQLTSTVATGTAPLVVTSTTPVANLNIGGNAATVTTNANLTGVVTSTGNATAIADGALSIAKTSGLQTTIDGKVADAINDATTTVAPSQNAVFDALALKAPIASPTFTGDAKAVTATAGDNDVSIATTEFVTSAITSANATNANLTGMVTSVGNTTTVVTNANLSGAVTSSGNTTSLGSFTSANLATALTDETGTGVAVLATSPTLVTPVLGAATGTSLSVSGQLTSTVATGTAPLVVTSTTPVANLNIGGNAATVTTNANLTGVVTSSGNTTAIAAGVITNTMLANTAVANLSGTNTGDNAVNSLYSGLVSNATHTGDVTGATTLTLATVNSNIGSFGTSTSVPTFTVNAKGLVTAASATAIPTATATTAGLLTSTDWTTFNNKQGTITLSTTGTSGASSFTSNTLNIPTYTLSGLGGQPLATNLTSIGGLTNATGVLVNNGTGTFSYSTTPTLTGTNFSGVPYTALSGTVPTWNQNTTGTSANVTGTVAVGNGGTGVSTITGLVKGTGTTAMTAATAGTDYSAGTSALASGIVKSTTSTGALSIAVAGTDYIAPYTSQTANFILASPSGSAGTPSFRALTATDVPTLNQNTTGNAATATATGITDDATTTTAVYPTFVTGTSGNLPQKVTSTKLAFVPSTGALSATSFVKSGGTSAQFLMADGSVSSGTPLLTEADIEVTATAAGETSFALTQTPSSLSKVKMYINGIRISATAYTISGSTLTYIPANNESYSISVGDRVQFEFAY